MDRKTNLKNKLKLFKTVLSKEIPVKTMLFFGSRAKGNSKKYSDVDLLIVSDKFKNKKFHERPVKVYDYWTLDYPVDFLCYTQEEFMNFKRRIGIVAEAVKNGIEI